VGADLIAVGMHPPRARNRLVDFSTGARLLRQAPCSVLASPVSRVARVFHGDTGDRYWATGPEWFDVALPS
jgi:hypothetical protein